MNKISAGPLAGITVLDFTWVLAGPHASKYLRDLGAEVVKVENFQKGGTERSFPYRVETEGGFQSSYAINVNRGKKSICINLKSAEGMQIIRDLVDKADIVMENFAPGVMARLGLDYDSIKKMKENIIYCSISCFGHWGPYSTKVGYDIIAQSASGWTAQTNPVNQAPVSIGDMNSSMHAVTAVLAAVVHRQKTGEGQNIDISMMDCLFSLHENTLPWYTISSAVGKPIDPPRISRHHAGFAPYGIYNGKNGSVAIAMLTDLRWGGLLELMGEHGKPLHDPRFATVAGRCNPNNAKEVHDAVESWVMSLDSVEQAEAALDEVGVPCMRVRGIVELVDRDPHVKAREMMIEIDQPFIGPLKMYGCPLKFSKTPSGPRGHCPFIGEHNVEVLSGLLGYGEEKIQNLYRNNVLWHEDAVNKLDDYRERSKNGKMAKAS